MAPAPTPAPILALKPKHQRTRLSVAAISRCARRALARPVAGFAVALSLMAGVVQPVWAQAAPAAAAPSSAVNATPDGLIRAVSVEIIDTVKADKAIQAGDLSRIISLVDAKVMPHVNFQRMTASAVGRHWRTATPEQQKRLQDEFKLLLVRTYAGALTQVKDQTVQLKPMRATPTDTEVVVRTEVRGKGEPIQLDYRLEKVGDGWKVYDLNVLGIWLVEQYRSSFAQEINAGGVDGLIAKLAERNKAAARG